MKKYMKPIMESESFVANEYVAACWTLTCVGTCGGVETSQSSSLSAGSYFDYDEFDGNAPCTTKVDTDRLTIDSLEDFFKLVKDAFNTNMSIFEFFDIIVNGKEIETKTPVHPINVTSGWPASTGHPNASV